MATGSILRDIVIDNQEDTEKLIEVLEKSEREDAMNGLVPIEHDGQRVLTTQQLAEGYGTEARRVSENFNRNKERFIEGKHYYYLEGEILKEFKSEYAICVVAENLNKLYLWTEKGALLHAKSLNTDKAWEVYDVLVETYFRVKDYLQNQFVVPQTMSEALRLAADLAEENDRLKEQEQLLLPQAEGYQLIVNCDNAQSMNDFAKSMNWGRNRLYGQLRKNGIFMVNSVIPYQRFCNDGYFIVKYTEKNGKTFPYTLITPKGMKYVISKVQEWGLISELLAG